MMTTRTITGTWTEADGATPAAGSVELVPSQRLDGPTSITVGVPLRVTLDATGSITVDLPCTDDPTIRPAGWVWQITEHMQGRTPVRWAFELPAGSGPLDLADVDTAEIDPCGCPGRWLRGAAGPPGPPGRDGTSAPGDPAVADLLIVATDGDRPAVPRPGQRVFNLSRGTIDVFDQALGAWEVVGQPIRRPDIASLPTTMLPGAVATVGGDLMILTEDTTAPGTLRWVVPGGLGPVTHLATAPITWQDLREKPDRLAVRAAIRAAMPLAGWYAWADAATGLTLAWVAVPPRPSTGGDTFSFTLFLGAAVACWNFQAGANGLRELGSIMSAGTTTWFNSQFVKPPAAPTLPTPVAAVGFASYGVDAIIRPGLASANGNLVKDRSLARDAAGTLWLALKDLAPGSAAPTEGADWTRIVMAKDLRALGTDPTVTDITTLKAKLAAL